MVYFIGLGIVHTGFMLSLVFFAVNSLGLFSQGFSPRQRSGWNLETNGRDALLRKRFNSGAQFA